MLRILLQTGFGIASSRLGPHWQLSEQEADALAEPITNIMARHDLLKLTGQYGDYIALAAAIGIVIVPKVMISLEQAKARKGGANVVRLSNKPVQREQQQQRRDQAAGADKPEGATVGGSGEPVSGTSAAYDAATGKGAVAAVVGGIV